MKRWSFALLSTLLILSMILAACGGDEEEPTTPPETVEETAEETVEETADEPVEVDFPVMPGGFLERAIAGEFAGTSVTVDGPFTDADEVKFKESYAAFEEATGISINYVGNKEFEGTISIRVDAGDAPDIADFPQPGLLSNFVRTGKVVDVSSFIPDSWLKQQYNDSWLQMGMMDAPEGEIMAGVWYRFNGKSLVWYPKDDFDAAGYEVPTTWDELIALSDMIVADGDAPWCVGIESGAATGWPATDWMEEFMLRTTSLENYDKWTTGELPFSSPEVKNAAETLGELWFNEDYVFGGTAGIVSTFFGDAPAPMFEDPPRCWLHKQGNFITGFFPEDAEADVDYGFFYLPPIDPAYGKPFLVAGDIMAMFHDRPEVRALMEYFTVPESAKGWLETGGALATHLTATPEMYGVALERGIAALVAEATSFRFDGSDLMPGEVGAGSFWKGMTDWVSGSADLDTVLAEIEASWPAGVEGEVSGPGESGIGTAETPIKVLFVPSVDVDFMIAGGDLIGQALQEATGLYFDVSVPTSYAATIEEMCASPEDTIGFIPAMGYALANQLCGVEPGLASERYGWNVYWTEFVVARDSDFQTLEDLEGATWAYPDAGSTSGFLYPSAIFDDLGITIGDMVEAGGHPQSVKAVYNGEADVGTAYFSAPLLPEGNWAMGDPPDIPDEFIDECGVNDEGKLYCGEYRVLDARAAISEEAPDVVQKVRILALSGEIPNDTMSFSPEFPDDLKETIKEAMIAYIASDACLETLCNERFYDWTGAGPIYDENFDGVRLLMEAQGITLESLGE